MRRSHRSRRLTPLLSTAQCRHPTRWRRDAIGYGRAPGLAAHRSQILLEGDAQWKHRGVSMGVTMMVLPPVGTSKWYRYRSVTDLPIYRYFPQRQAAANAGP